MACIMFANINAQTLKKTFYDWNKTQPKEVYYVNAKGEKNGTYKSYHDNGLIGIEANFKNGSLDGLYKEYTGYGGKSCCVKSVTYKNDELNGPATYYSNQHCNVIASQGNIVSGKRIGVWTFTEETSQDFPEGFKFISYSQKIEGEKVIEDSKIVYYHPSKKIFSEIKGNQKISYSPEGKIIGEETFSANGETVEEKYFFKSGSLAEHSKNYFEGGKKIVEKNSWYENGKVKIKSKTIDNVTSYEGYKEDGSKDSEMIRIEQQKERDEKSNKDHEQYLAKQRSEFNGLINAADILFNKKSYEKAKERYYTIEQDAGRAIKDMHSDTTNTAFLLNKIQYAQGKMSETKKMIELDNALQKQFAEVARKYKEFTNLYVEKKNTQKTDANFNLIYSYSYPKGEHLYTKADSHYKEHENVYGNEADVTKSLEQGKKLIEILDKLITLASTETSDLNKKLKKAKTKEEETQLLGF